MEENKIDFLCESYKSNASQYEYDLKNDSILNLSYIGDAIFDFLSRDYVLKK